MDSLAIIASLLSSLFIISAEVTIFSSDGELVVAYNKYKQFIYIILIFFSWFIIVSIGIAYIM